MSGLRARPVRTKHLPPSRYINEVQALESLGPMAAFAGWGQRTWNNAVTPGWSWMGVRAWISVWGRLAPARCLSAPWALAVTSSATLELLG